VHIFVAQGEAMLDVSDFLLTAKTRYYAEGCRDLEIEVPWMQDGFEGIEYPLSKDGVIQV
jgi:hypothetical protein